MENIQILEQVKDLLKHVVNDTQNNTKAERTLAGLLHHYIDALESEDQDKATMFKNTLTNNWN